MRSTSYLCGRLVLLLALAAPLRSLPAAAPARVDFGRDVLPVLSDKCYQCHGPDEKARKGKLRLDTKEGAFRVKEGKAVIVPGKSGESELIRRLTTTNPDDLMPPPDSNKKLSPAQIEILKRWVDQGAEWAVHWAFVPPAHPEPPATQLKNWARNGIDSFILARLEKEGLKPSPEARRETWLRRVTFDLTGLPPTQEELDAFAADNSAGAHEKVVDRLLASPRYGERMAADWLDIARYADTHGYQMDRYRAVWPYRDWVIRAFNRNLPFDQFGTWQLAGDLLPGATKEQRLATAFNRLHMQNEEGGIVEEEYRVAYVVDRVNTMGTAFLGLTFECSRCHDHKYDPVSMRDFYSLFSMFQNIDESGQTVYFGEVMPVPTLLLSTDDQDARLTALQKTIRERERALEAARLQARGPFEEWLRSRETVTNRTAFSSIPGLTAAYAFDDLNENKAANSAAGGKPGNAVESPQLTEGKSGKAALLTGENGFTFPGAGGFTRADPFSFGLWLQTSNHASRLVVVHKSRAWMDAGSRGYELLLEEGRPAVGLHHMWPGNAIKLRARAPIPTNEWTHLAVTYDGSSRASGVRVYVNGKPAPLEVLRDGLWKDFTYGGGEPDLAIGFRMRDVGFKGGKVDDFQVFDRELTAIEAEQLAGLGSLAKCLAAAPSALNAEQREALFAFYFANLHPLAARHREALHEARREQNRLVTSINDIMVMQEMPDPKKAFVLKRGAYDMRSEEVVADTPKALPPLASGEPRNRLGLARWLFSPGHPLTARVTVNRAWQQMFGRGIVETSDNFGSQGAQPSHPELLDWLAREFSDGWDMKRLLKLIALSATYRQSSQPAPELLARDAENRLLARGPARRLTAEMLRDQALAASGLLVEKQGGPSVKPYQPEGLWEEIAMGRPHYDTGKGEDLHRRSLYTFWKRTVPPPTMITFDSAERNVCVARRQSTSTPLQALALLNDTQIIEAARRLGERMFKEGGRTLDEQVAWAFRTATSRKPSQKEIKVLKQLFTEQRAHFAADQQAAMKLLLTGEATSDPALPIADLAGGTILAEAILNHDEAVLRR